jgi:hypothetical protein
VSAFCIGEPSIRSGGASNEKLFHLESLVVCRSSQAAANERSAPK